MLRRWSPILLVLLALPACEAAKLAADVLVPDPQVKDVCEHAEDARLAHVTAQNRLFDLRQEAAGLSPARPADVPRLREMATEVNLALVDERQAHQTLLTLQQACIATGRPL